MRLTIPVLLLAVAAAAAAGEHPGAVLFRQKPCVGCHGADGSANTPVGKAVKARDLRSEEVQKQSDEELAKVIAEGRGKMPSFKASLDAKQIRDLVAFIRTLKKQ